MKKVMLDSCVFFKMIKYNLVYQQYGKEGLRSYLNHRIEELNKLQEKLNDMMGDRYTGLKKNEKLSFHEKLHAYKEWAKNEKSSLELKIANKRWNIETNKQIPPARVAEMEEEIKEYQKSLDKILEFEKIAGDRGVYFEEEDSISCGCLFEAYVEGKLEFYICDYSFEEIMSHTNLEMLKNKTEKPQWLEIDENVLKILIEKYEKRLADPHHKFYGESEVCSLLKNVSIITTSSKEIRNKIENLARLYRTKDGKIAMRDDTNSVEKYGDSCIMAVASMVGITLLTHNARDFIFDSKGDTKRREHIQKRNSQVDYATDTCAVSPEEYLLGVGFEEPKKESVFDLVERESLVADKEICIE